MLGVKPLDATDLVGRIPARGRSLPAQAALWPIWVPPCCSTALPAFRAAWKRGLWFPASVQVFFFEVTSFFFFKVQSALQQTALTFFFSYFSSVLWATYYFVNVVCRALKLSPIVSDGASSTELTILFGLSSSNSQLNKIKSTCRFLTLKREKGKKCKCNFHL